MATIFSKIISGEIPAYKIAESEKFLAFLDVNPLAVGHTLVIPKQENDYIFDLDDDTLAQLMVYAKKIAIALNTAIECKRVGVLVIGTEVRHTHIHLIPFRTETQMSFTSPKLKFTPEEFSATVEKIKAHL